MNKPLSWLLIASVLAGCTDTPATKSPAPPVSTPTPPVAVAPTVPAELKHAAFEYYGFGRTEALPFEMKEANKPAKAGTLEQRLIEVKDGKAIYEQKFTGELQGNFDSKLFVDKTGVYTNMLSGSDLSEPQLELPADVHPGSAWNITKPITAGSLMTIKKMWTKAAAIESITVPRGKFECLRVEATVLTSQGGTDYNFTMRVWYAKGIGAVKLVTQSKGGGKTASQVWQAIK